MKKKTDEIDELQERYTQLGQVEHSEAILVADRTTNLFVDPAGGVGYARSVRSQADNLGDSMSTATGIDFSGEESLTRTEFAEEASMDYILKNFGVGTTLRPIKYGEEVDFQLGLGDAIELLNRVEPIKDAVPPELRAKYPNWRVLVQAVNSGEYEHDLAAIERLKKAKETPSPETPKTGTTP